MGSLEDFAARMQTIATAEDLHQLRKKVLDTENIYREFFARQRESWEIPEIDDPYVYLWNVFGGHGSQDDIVSPHSTTLKRLPRLDNHTPRCFELSDEKRAPAGSFATVPTLKDFDVSWECLTEGLLRHLDWSNVFCAGGAVAGCLAPLPAEIQNLGPSATRVKRRKYFHEEYLPGSDVDLFLYGLTEEEGLMKLQEIYDAVQAANPYEVRAFRSRHAITLVSQYPFRHIQIVLRLYNSPSEILMGFDVDACAVGYDGNKVWCCPRTALAMMTQSNTVDLSRRSPSYEMRLAKYAERGFEVLIPSLQRARVDPFLFEKRFDQAKGLARLLLLERLRSPEERLRYRIESQLKMQGHRNLEWMIRKKMQEKISQVGSLERAEGADFIVPMPTGAELSNYSTIFLPWGVAWNAQRIEKVTRKKDKILNSVEFRGDGRVLRSRRKYKMHLCAVGTMEEVVQDPFPDDPPLPQDIPTETLETLVYGPVSWIIDNPGRQQIGSFHPITDEDWMEGAYFSKATEELIAATFGNKVEKIREILHGCNTDDEVRSLLLARDFLGRSVLHVAVLSKSKEAVEVLLRHPAANAEFWSCRTPNGRMALHLASIHNEVNMIQTLLEHRNKFIEKAEDEEAALELMDLDTGDWEIKMCPLHYAIVLGNVDVAKLLVKNGASARKVSVHKDQNRTESSLSLLALYASECGTDWGFDAIKPMAELLFKHGATPLQVDTRGYTCWHRFAACFKQSSLDAMKILLELDKETTKADKVRGIDVMDKGFSTPVFVATAVGNVRALELLLDYGATPNFTEDQWSLRIRQLNAETGSNSNFRYQMMNDMEAQRCPISRAASNADFACIKAFLDRHADLAKIHIKVRAYYSGPEQQTSILDLLHSFKKEMAENGKQQLDQIAKRVEACKVTVTNSENEKLACQEGSYAYMWWSNQLARDHRALDEEMIQYKIAEGNQEGNQEENEAKERVLSAIQLVEDNGGMQLLSRSESTHQTMSTAYSMGISQVQPSPYASIREPEGFNFLHASSRTQGASTGNYNYGRCTDLSEGERNVVVDLMALISSGTAKIPFDTLNKARMCVYDNFGHNPFFIATLKNDKQIAKRVFEAAIIQYKAFIAKKAKRDTDILEIKASAEGDDIEASLKDQLRQLNNLDIAGGEIPKNKSLSREQLRQEVEVAEIFASQQNEVDTGSQPIFSRVPPEFLLLARAAIFNHTEPKLLKLKQKLNNIYSSSFPTQWVKREVGLRPIELAVIRGDVDMVEMLLTLASKGSTMLHLNFQLSKLDELRPDVGEIDLDVDEEGSEENSEYSDGGNDMGVAMGLDDSNKIESFSLTEMRYLLTGNGSANSDFGGMSLLQLAIVVGNSNILALVLKFAKENVLPGGAIAFWKSNVEATVERDEKTREKQEEENKLVSGERCNYWSNRQAVPLWACKSESNLHQSSDSTSVANMPTLIQFALAVESTGLVKELIAGCFDDTMLSWIDDQDYKSQLPFPTSGMQEDYRAMLIAARWLQKETRDRAELLYRLIRPTAVDAAGRHALFYCPVDMLDTILEAGVSTLQEQGYGTIEANARFLEAVSSKGLVTPLLVAVSAANISMTKALLSMGCKRSNEVGPKHWNSLHWAIQARPNEEGNPSWTTSKDMIQVLLDGATDDERRELLLAPNAEHSPLMLAANQGADEAVISLLIKETASLLFDGINHRDSELNSILHIAVRREIATMKNGDTVNSILAFDKDFSVSLPLAENARGVTPIEMAIHSIAMIWNRVKDISTCNNERFNRTGRHSRRGLRVFDSNPSSQTKPNEKLASVDRSVRRDLILAASDNQRIGVSLEQVQLAKEHSAKKASKDVSNIMNSSIFSSQNEGGMQSLPCGPPAISPQNRKSNHRFF